MDKTKYIKANSVAFSGHRTIAEDRKDDIRKKLRGKIRLLYAMGITNFYCGMALGFDMLAAEEVISLKVELPNLKLIAVIPYGGTFYTCRKAKSMGMDIINLYKSQV